MSARSPLPALWHGLVKPSPGATLVMLAVALGAWTALWFGLTPERAERLAPYLAEDPRDSYAFVTGRLNRLPAMVASGRPGVLFIGASGLRYGIGDFDRVEELLAERHVDAWVLDLTSDDQSLLETISILHLVPDDFDGVVVAGTNPHRLSRTIALPSPDADFVYRLGVRSPFLASWRDAEGLDPVAARGHFWDNRDFFLPRVGHLARNLWDGPPNEFQPKSDNNRRVGDQRWNDFCASQRKIAARFAQNGRTNLTQLARAVQAFRSRTSAPVALVEAPLAPRAADEAYGLEFLATYTRRIEQFARNQGLPYWKVQAEATLTEDDFFDWMHLRRGVARERYSVAIVGRVVGLLKRG